ncbi:HNH endonuclease [Chryseobacterium indologenes]|nr:HNH endonuclease [Chryseobacterium indologenes]
MLSLELPTGEFVRVTPEHRFFCNDEWIEAGSLKAGDLLHLKGGDYTTVISVEVLPHYEKVYNFDIEDNENYYVTEDGILVHNGYASAAELQKIEDRGFTGVQATPNGGLNYANSDALYPVKPGQRNIIEIDYSGDYTTDFQNASMKALGQKSTPRGYVWHHLDDYNAGTNRGTMQLVKQEAHNGVSHMGGCSQYKEATGNSYTFKTW